MLEAALREGTFRSAGYQLFGQGLPIITQRSLEMIIGIFVIIKAGGVYLPLTPDIPESRMELIIKDYNAPLVLSEQAWLDKLKNTWYAGKSGSVTLPGI